MNIISHFNKILECFDSAKFEILVIIKGNSL